MNQSAPPKPDEFEVSIIGPGRGECIILHLGDNNWCVVDSCIARGSDECVAIDYLRSFQNGAHEQVKLIVATHWHDDHIRGLASVLRQVPAARFCCSLALDNDNFAQLVAIVADSMQRRSGVDEFRSIYDLLLQRKDAGVPVELVAPIFAIENRTLLELPAAGRSCSASVKALSPSDGTVRLAFADIARWLPKQGEPQRRLANRAPNRTSVVLLVEVGKRRALLGADLEHTGRQGEGWLAVLASQEQGTQAAVFKVPHHGSANADCEQIWTRMLQENPVAVVTPFTGGNVALPRKSDIRRLSGRTTNLYCTAETPTRLPRRDSAVEKIMKRVLKNRRILQGQPGHVRVRWSANGESEPLHVETFNGAFRAAPRDSK